MARESHRVRQEAGGRLIVALARMDEPLRGEVADLIAALPLSPPVRAEVLRLATTPSGADLASVSAWVGLGTAPLGPALAGALIDLWPTRDRVAPMAREAWAEVRAQAQAGGAE